MFSRLDKTNYNKRVATAQQNAVDIIHLAGADVLWISNNNGSCKGVCTRVKTQQIDTNKSNPLCDGEYCYDEALLKPLSAKLSELTHENTYETHSYLVSTGSLFCPQVEPVSNFRSFCVPSFGIQWDVPWEIPLDIP